MLYLLYLIGAGKAIIFYSSYWKLNDKSVPGLQTFLQHLVVINLSTFRYLCNVQSAVSTLRSAAWSGRICSAHAQLRSPVLCEQCLCTYEWSSCTVPLATPPRVGILAWTPLRGVSHPWGSGEVMGE